MTVSNNDTSIDLSHPFLLRKCFAKAWERNDDKILAMKKISILYFQVIFCRKTDTISEHKT